MSSCPRGHESADDEFCEICGLEMGGAPAAAAAPAAPAAVPMPATPDPDVPPPGTRCAACGGELSGRFCEECGQDWLQPVAAAQAPAARREWVVTVAADREYFRTVVGEDDAIAFPRFFPERTFALDGAQITVGRASRSRGIHPDINLIGPPEDPGISHLHAMLLADGGGWAVVDLNSANGTAVNGTALPPETPRPVSDGDVIHLGAWTRITVHGT